MSFPSLPELRRHREDSLSVGVTQRGVHTVQGAGGVYPLGPLTQVFTGALLAVQVSRGELRLDTPLSELIPRSLLPDEAAGRITLAQLATHTAGLPSLPPNLQAPKPEDPLGGYTAMHFGDFLRNLRPAQAAPYPYAESLLGLGILGHALGRRASLNYGHALRDLVCTPLGLTDTTTRLSDEQQARLRTGHDARGQAVPPWTFPSLPGAGAVHSTVPDLLRFLDAQLGRGPAPSSALRLTQMPQARVGAQRQVGLGWLIQQGAGGPLLWRAASLGGFSGFLGLAPAAQVGVVLLLDRGRSRLDALLGRTPLEREGLALLERLAR